MVTERTYFVDDTQAEMERIVVLETDEDELRVIPEYDDKWYQPIWMPRDEFEWITAPKNVKPVGELSADKVAEIKIQAEN